MHQWKNVYTHNLTKRAQSIIFGSITTPNTAHSCGW